MTERFVRTKDGRIVFQALAAVGIDNAVATHMHGYRDNGFPNESPSEIPAIDIWSAFSGSLQANASAQK